MLRRVIVYTSLLAGIGTVMLLQARATRIEAPRAAAVTDAGGAGPGTDPDARYRLSPDARVLLAVEDVRRLLTGVADERATASFAGGRWRVLCGGTEVGTLPEWPDFPDLVALLSRWATRLGAAESLAVPAPPDSAEIERRLDGLRALESAGLAAGRRPPRAPGPGLTRAPADTTDIDQRLRTLHALAAADLADRQWRAGVRDPVLVRQAARALVLLAVETPDRVGASDRVVARALALAAIAGAAGPDSSWRERCLLAEVMGYAAFAREAAARLPPEDPVRLYACREDPALFEAARARDATQEARLLSLVRLAERRDMTGWTDWRDRYFAGDDAVALPVVCAAPADGRSVLASAGGIALAQVAREMRLLGISSPDPAPTPEDATLAGLANGFERLMKGMPASADGAFLDRELLRARYRGCFYSALAAFGGLLGEALPPGSDPDRFAGEPGEAGGGAAGEFQRWHLHLADSRDGHSAPGVLQRDFDTLPHFGAPMLLATYRAIRASASFPDPRLRLAARSLARRLDTRPWHRRELGWIAYQDLRDLARAEDLLGSAAACLGESDVRLAAWWAAYRGDHTALDALLARRGLTATEQADILGAFRTAPGADRGTLSAAYERALAAHPESWALADGFARHLEDAADRGRARAVLERWLGRHDRYDRSPEAISARTRLARLCELDGQYPRGLQWVAPVFEGHPLGPTAARARLLDRVGRTREADSLAGDALQRHPESSEALVLAVELHWRQGQPELAARLLARSLFPLDQACWRAELGPRFVACFEGRPEAARQAAHALRDAGLDGGVTIVPLADAVAQAGDHHLAFEMVSGLRVQGERGLEVAVRAYGHLKRWMGGREAINWFKQQTLGAGDLDRAALGCLACESGAYELVWELQPPAAASGQSEYFWVLRAYAALHTGGRYDRHWRELESHFRPSGGDVHRVLGRYLVGLAREREALEAAREPRDVCEMRYCAGLKAQVEGRYRAAADWYARCLEMAEVGTAEQRFAAEQLSAWAARRTSLERLAAAEGQDAPAADLGSGRRTMAATDP